MAIGTACLLLLLLVQEVGGCEMMGKLKENMPQWVGVSPHMREHKRRAQTIHFQDIHTILIKFKPKSILIIQRVPYSHFVNKSWGYPTDCSGFVSWALQTKNSVGRDLKAFEYGSAKYAAALPLIPM